MCGGSFRSVCVCCKVNGCECRHHSRLFVSPAFVVVVSVAAGPRRRSSLALNVVCIMFARSRSGGGGAGAAVGIGNGAAAFNLQTLFALCGLLLVVPQLASSTILDKLRDGSDLSEVSAILSI